MSKKPPARRAKPPVVSGPSRPAAPPRSTTAPPDDIPAAPQNRWQRTVRYSWDKGGSKGGRR